MAKIHPTAIIDTSSEIADSAEIGAYAYIGNNCIIGDGVKVGNHSVIECHTEIGARTVIFPHACIGTDPQDISYKGEDTKLIIGKDCIIREHTSLTRGTTKDDWKTEIGNNCMLMALTHVGHDCKVGNNVILVSGAMIAGHVHLDDYVTLSAYAALHQFVRVGAYSMIGGMSRVVQDVPPFCLVVGADDCTINGLNIVGLKRNGMLPKVRMELKRALKIYLNKSLLLSEVKEELLTLEQYPEVLKFKEFLDNSKRGIIRK